MPSKDLIFNIIGIDRASKTFDKVGAKAEGVGSKLTKFGIVGAAGIAAVGVAAGVLAKTSIDKFQDAAGAALALQRVLGGTAEGASQLNFAAEETGVSQEKLTLGIKALSTHLSANDKAWKMTGLSVKDAHGNLLTTTAALPKLADIFSKMPAGAQKSALAVKLFGKSGLTLLPLLNRGSDGLKALSDESDKLGHTLSGPQLAAVHSVTIAHRQFSAAVSGLEIQIGAQLYPALTKIIPRVAAFATSFTEKAIPVIKEFAAWFGSKLMPALEQAYQRIMPGVTKAFDSVTKSLDGGKGGWKSVGDAIIGFIKVASQVTSVVLPLMIRLWGIQIHTYQLAWKAVQTLGSITHTVVVDIVKVFLGMVGTIIDGAARAFGWVPGIGPKLKAAAKKFDDFRKQVNDSLDGVHRDVTINFHAQLDSALRQVIANPKLAQSLHGTFGAAFGNGTAVKPHRAGGGPVKAGFAYQVNEMGQETFIPSVNGTIRPAGAFGGGSILNVHFHGVIDSSSAAREIETLLLKRRLANGKPLAFIG